MVRKNKIKSRKSQQARRFRRRRRGVTTTAPPLIPFNRVLANTILRGSIEKTFDPDVMNVLDFTTSAIVANWSKLLSAYKEIKIKKVNVWITPYSSTSENGMIASIVAPKDEVESSGLTWQNFITTPGAMVRKIYQTTKGVYFPTEPSERDWFLTSKTDRHLFVVCTMVTGITASNAIKTKSTKCIIVWDAHVLLRGKAKGSSSIQLTSDQIVRSVIDQHAISPSDDFENLVI